MTSQNTVLYTPFADGRTVRDIVEHSPALVSEAWCRRILQHILQSLEQQYASHAPHRIISPDSVVVLENGEALLLPSPDGLASDEADSAGDIHALALVMHYAISAEDPPDGPLGPRLYDDYSDQLTQAIDRCLGPNLRLRPKNIAEFRAMLGLEAGAAADEQTVHELAAVQAGETPAIVPVPAAQEASLELSKAEEPEPLEPLQPLPPFETLAQTPPLAPPPPRPEPKPASPIAATPLKPSAHSTSAAAAPAPAPVRPKADVQALSGRKTKSGIERWAMIAGAAIVVLAAGSALYAHLNQDSSDDVLAASLPQEPAAQGLDAGEAVVAPATDAAAPGGADTAAAATGDITPDTTDAATATATLPESASGDNAARTAAASGTRHADAVVNGTTYKLLIKPWGTVYVNGVDRGVSPPVKRLTLGQGQHTIRIVNPNFAEHVMTVNAGGAESATIEHDFTAPAEGGR
ncbi:MAG: PEGA domain-containing protein [Pseudomonadota bacterium]